MKRQLVAGLGGTIAAGLVGATVVGCGGGTAKGAEAAPAPAPATAPAPESASVTAPSGSASGPAADPAPASSGLPSACADPNGTVCTPPSSFVDKLCAKPHQDVALALFGKTPFSRLYLRGKLDELSPDEEVLALRFHGVPKGGMVVGSGNGTYDVLRWDGSCSIAVEAEMLSKSKPGRAKTSGVKWHRVSTRIQDAMIGASDAVKKAHAKRGKECQGAMSGDVSLACQKADQALTDAVVDFVRDGGSIPSPDSP